MKLSLLLVAAIGALSGCGGGGADADPAPQDVPPLLGLETLPPGSLPGKQVNGNFRVPGRRSVRYVRELTATGTGIRRTALLIARGSHRELCFTAVIGIRVRRASFSCLQRWDRPPLLLRASVGGRSRAVTQWMAVVGLVRRGVKRVTVESQAGITSRTRLHAWPGFPWKAYATPPAFRYRLPSTVSAWDRSGTVVQEVDLGWAYGAACGEQGAHRCKRRDRRAGPWSAVRDPITRAQAPFIKRAGGRQSKRLAIDHPVVRRLVTNRAFSIGTVALWQKCDGGVIGGLVPIRLANPVDFEGDVPVRQYDASSHTAYLEGVAHLRVERAVSFLIAVDLNREKVVGIDYDPARGSGSLKPKVDMTLIGEMRPAGGPDSGSCGEQGD
jgi:hypothetical protein